MRIRRFLLAAGLVCLTCGTASAQGAGKTGVTMGYPASIGVIWHASDKVAIRPELSLIGGSRVLSPAGLGLEPPPGQAAGAVPASWTVPGNEGFREAKERLIAASERNYVTQLLKSSSGNVSRAAREGGIDRVYLHRLMKRLGIGGPDEPG